LRLSASQCFAASPKNTCCTFPGAELIARGLPSAVYDPLEPADPEELLRGSDNLWPVREMHRVVMVRLAAPDEAVLLENIHDLPGNLIFVPIPAVGVRLRP
jgi:hypothetical protein